MKNKVVYLTGAPASGKSTTAKELVVAMPELLHWEYGAKLTELVLMRDDSVIDQVDIRARSSKVITPDDVAKLDGQLLTFVNDNRGSFPIIIDSHPVTKEEYGFRITPFSLSEFVLLAPDEIWVLYTPPEVAVQRIRANPKGRPLITKEQARMHTELQSSVAATYGMAIGMPVYLFDTSGSKDSLLATLISRFQ